MTVERAFLILGVGPECDIKKLNATFRRLAKKYHPDANGSRAARANERMTQLNLAYETVLAYLAELEIGGQERDELRSDAAGTRRSGGNGRGAKPTPPAGKPADAAAEDSPAARQAAGRSVDEIHEAIYLYYQYGLENVHQRTVGVGRFRYREALRKLKTGTVRLGETLPKLSNPHTLQAYRAFHAFSEIFLENIQLDRYYVPSPDQVEAGGYRHYLNASRTLDLAIRDLFCSELAAGRRTRHYTSDHLKVVETELMTVVTRYSSCTWVTETLIKIELLSRFVEGMRCCAPMV